MVPRVVIIWFVDIDNDFYRQLMLVGPFGIMNNSPIFWTRKCRIVEIYNLKGKHLKLTLDDGTASIDAIKGKKDHCHRICTRNGRSNFALVRLRMRTRHRNGYSR